MTSECRAHALHETAQLGNVSQKLFAREIREQLQEWFASNRGFLFLFNVVVMPPRQERGTDLQRTSREVFYFASALAGLKLKLDEEKGENMP